MKCCEAAQSPSTFSGLSDTGLLRLRHARGAADGVGVLARGEAEQGVVDAADVEEQEGEEQGPGEEIEDAVEDHLGCGRDDVAALRAAPGDRV